MIVVDGFPFVERCFEVQFSVFVLALSDEEGSELDGDSSSLGGGDEPVLSVCVFVEDGCEEAAEGLSSYRRVLIAPCSVSADVDGKITAVAWRWKREGDLAHGGGKGRLEGGLVAVVLRRGRRLDIGGEGRRRHKIG